MKDSPPEFLKATEEKFLEICPEECPTDSSKEFFKDYHNSSCEFLIWFHKMFIYNILGRICEKTSECFPDGISEKYGWNFPCGIPEIFLCVLPQGLSGGISKWVFEVCSGGGFVGILGRIPGRTSNRITGAKPGRVLKRIPWKFSGKKTLICKVFPGTEKLLESFCKEVSRRISKELLVEFLNEYLEELFKNSLPEFLKATEVTFLEIYPEGF